MTPTQQIKYIEKHTGQLRFTPDFTTLPLADGEFLLWDSGIGVPSSFSTAVSEILALTDGTPGIKIQRKVIGLYDFAVDGGTMGDINLTGTEMPVGTVITRAWLRVITPPTGGVFSTIGIGIDSDDPSGMLPFTTSISDPIWTAGWHDLIPSGTSATFSNETTSVDRQLQLQVAGADLTDGKFYVVAEILSLVV